MDTPDKLKRGTGCESCNFNGRVDVLDVWGVQRRGIAGKPIEKALGDADNLPLLREAAMCPFCGDEEQHERDWAELERQQGGNPWDEKTYRGNA
jgi:hypothetical protein